MVAKLKLANFPIFFNKFQHFTNQFPDNFQTLTKLNEPGNKHIICHHVIYELLRHKYVNRRAKIAFNEKIVQMMGVFAAYYVNITPKWVGLI